MKATLKDGAQGTREDPAGWLDELMPSR